MAKRHTAAAAACLLLADAAFASGKYVQGFRSAWTPPMAPTSA